MGGRGGEGKMKMETGKGPYLSEVHGLIEGAVGRVS